MKRLNSPFVAFAVASALLTAISLAGCGQPTSNPSPTSVADSQPGAVDAAGDGHDHSGWWCSEHGVPEEECSMCSSKAADDFKAKGDWCEEHNRAESQCFKCDPSARRDTRSCMSPSSARRRPNGRTNIANRFDRRVRAAEPGTAKPCRIENWGRG